jgi:hypothetical protein
VSLTASTTPLSLPQFHFVLHGPYAAFPGSYLKFLIENSKEPT